MTDFDKIIKQKVESKHFAYSAKAWRGFAKKAGMKTALSTAQSVVLGVVGVAVVAVGSYWGYQLLSPEQTPQPAPSAPEASAEIVVADTTESVEDVVVLTEDRALENSPATSSQRVATEDATQAVAQPAIDTVAEAKPAKKPILRPKGSSRILVISTDTIRSND